MKKDIFTRLRNGEAIDMQTDEDYKGLSLIHISEPTRPY